MIIYIYTLLHSYLRQVVTRTRGIKIGCSGLKIGVTCQNQGSRLKQGQLKGRCEANRSHLRKEKKRVTILGTMVRFSLRFLSEPLTQHFTLRGHLLIFHRASIITQGSIVQNRPVNLPCRFDDQKAESDKRFRSTKMNRSER